MRLRRLAWNTPSGAMLWELGSRHKWPFTAQAAGLLIGFMLALGSPRFSPGDRELFVVLVYQAGAFAVLQTLACFCHMEVDARRLQGGIPGHLFLKPVTTLRLVGVPMVCGGVLVVAVFLAWYGLVWRYAGFPAAQVPWIGLLLFSFTWCVQAVVWSSANLSWVAQIALVMLTAGLHVLVGLTPKLPLGIPVGGRLAMVTALLVGGFRLALVGVQRIRQGSWEGEGHAGPAGNSARGKVKRFRSAFWAQFWLEWQRQGRKLPLFTGLGMGCFILLDIAVGLVTHQSPDGVATFGESFTLLILNYALLTPYVCSLVMGSMLAQFDLSQPANEMPVFIAIRPLTNGGFVLAKLAMAAASSLVTWLVMAGTIAAWLMARWHATLVPQVGDLIRSEPAVLVMWLASFLLAVLLTWRNLVSGIWLGLSARPALIAGYDYLRAPFYLALFGLFIKAKDDAVFRALLFSWLPWAFGAALALKLLASGAAFHWGLRQKTITPGAIGWIAGGWLLCGGFVAALTWRVCAEVHLPGVWVGIALAGFWLLPLAQLAIAPMSLTWNRHR